MPKTVFHRQRVLKNRLYSHLAQDIPGNQFGFVKGRSTIQAIKLVIEQINTTVYSGAKKPLYALFLDVKKAFDSIATEDLFFKNLSTPENCSLRNSLSSQKCWT
jgi:Reverse transcriptase (RNA-dependent DNA polymerase)